MKSFLQVRDFKDKDAAVKLALNYLHGTDGLSKNLREAELELRQAARMNHPDAGRLLGRVLFKQGFKTEAFRFITKAAEDNDKAAQDWLGTLFAFGEGCKRDEAEARRWIAKSGFYQDVISLEDHLGFAALVVM